MRRPSTLPRAATLVLAPLLLMAAAPPPSAIVPVAADNDLLLVFTQAKPGDEKTFDRWLDHHVRQMLTIPGIKRAQRTHVSDVGRTGKVATDNATYYEIAGKSLYAADREIAARLKDGRLTPSDAVDQTKTVPILLRPMGPQTVAAEVPGASGPTAGTGPLRTYYLTVFSDPASPAQEDEFNGWYTLQHVPDVMRVPGFLNAQRFIRIGGSDKIARYAVVFRFRTRDMAATNAEIGRRIREGVTKMSPAFGAGNAFAFFATPAGG